MDVLSGLGKIRERHLLGLTGDDIHCGSQEQTLTTGITGGHQHRTFKCLHVHCCKQRNDGETPPSCRSSSGAKLSTKDNNPQQKRVRGMPTHLGDASKDGTRPMGAIFTAPTKTVGSFTHIFDQPPSPPPCLRGSGQHLLGFEAETNFLLYTHSQ
jgi:hypothetical protein